MMTVRYTAEMTDPITQETTTIEATSEAELEHLLNRSAIKPPQPAQQPHPARPATRSGSI